MKENELPLPWIFKSKILKENKKFFLIVIFLSHIAWILLAYTAGLGNRIAEELSLFAQLPVAIVLIFGSNRIIQKFTILTNIDIYDGKINSEKSEEFFAFKDIFKDGKIEKYQQEILESIYNKKEKLVVLSVMFGCIIIALINDIILVNCFGTMYYEYVYPWTIIGYTILILIYWSIFISPLLSSLFWVLLMIIKGVGLIGATDNLKIVSLNIKEKTKADIISFEKFKSDIQPISNLLYSISKIVIGFSFIYTLSVVLLFHPNTFHFSFSCIFVTVGVAIFIYPHLILHKLLNNARKNMLQEYNQIHKAMKIEYLMLLNKHTKKNITRKESLKNDLTIVKNIIDETEKLDTWPYNITRIYKLLGSSTVGVVGMYKYLGIIGIIQSIVGIIQSTLL